MTPKRYRKKPVEIEAMQFFGTIESANQVLAWIGKDHAARRAHSRKPEQGLLIGTLEGDMLARTGDWVIRGVQGEFYPCKPDIFQASYEQVDCTPTPLLTEAAGPVRCRDCGTTIERGDPCVDMRDGTGDVLCQTCGDEMGVI